MHFAIRKAIVKFIEVNRDKFTTVYVPSQSEDKETQLLAHISNMAKPHTWATQMEVLAAATYYRIPLYYCEMDEKNLYKWRAILPLSNLVFPVTLYLTCK